MTHVTYTPDNTYEGHQETICTALVQRKYGAIYEVQSNGKVAWWTHGCDPNKAVFTSSTACSQFAIGINPLTQETLYAYAPPVRAANSLDYSDSSGNRHYFIGWGTSTPPTSFIRVKV